MKNLKLKLAVLLIVAMLSLSFQTTLVQAHDIDELDPNNWITLPMFIATTTTRATISSEAGSYNYYYQIVFLTNTQYTTIQQKYDTAETNIKAAKADLDDLDEKLDAAYEKYQEENTKDPSSDATTQAREAYNALVTEYNKAAQEYNALVKAENAECQAVIPGFTESNWIQADDGSMEIDYGDRTGDTHFVIWAKLVADGETYYDCNVYSTTIKGDSYVTMSESTLTLKVGETHTLTATPGNSSESIVWSSSNEEVATVDQNGKVTALKEGTARIKATLADDSAEGVCTLTVTSASSTNTTTPQGNITIPSTQNQTAQQGNLVVNTSNQPTNISGNLDNTKATGTIPQTGVDFTIIWIIAGFGLIGWIAYRKYCKYNF